MHINRFFLKSYPMIRKKINLILVTIICVLYSLPSFSIEKELLGIRLGSDYQTTKDTLISKYGKPYKSERTNQFYDVFIRDEKPPNNIIIGTNKKYPHNIAWIQVSGDKPIPDLGFIGGINLGEKEKSIELLLSKPTKIRDSSHGYNQFRFDYSNFSIESKDGLIRSIRIDLSNAYSIRHKDRTDLIVLSANEAKYLHAGKDPYLYSIDTLKKHCKCRYPIRNHNDVYYIDVNVFGTDGTFHPFTFLLDTGWSDNAISKEVCSKINCKETTRETTGLKRQKVTGGFIGLGFEVFRFNEFFLDDREVHDKMGIDGVIGSSVLFSKGLFINLKNEYLCFPEKDLKEIAENLNFLKVNAMYDAGRIWVDFYANGQPVKDYFLDTGASVSSLLTDDIERLKLKHISQEEHLQANGVIKSKTFGPVIIGCPQISRKLEYVWESKTPEYRKIGNDFLGGTILGIDASSNSIYISE
jgi:hypothetical protein